jgi:hypothetical protein
MRYDLSSMGEPVRVDCSSVCSPLPPTGLVEQYICDHSHNDSSATLDCVSRVTGPSRGQSSRSRLDGFPSQSRPSSSTPQDSQHRTGVELPSQPCLPDNSKDIRSPTSSCCWQGVGPTPPRAIEAKGLLYFPYNLPVSSSAPSSPSQSATKTHQSRSPSNSGSKDSKWFKAMSRRLRRTLSNLLASDCPKPDTNIASPISHEVFHYPISGKIHSDPRDDCQRTSDCDGPSRTMTSGRVDACPKLQLPSDLSRFDPFSEVPYRWMGFEAKIKAQGRGPGDWGGKRNEPAQDATHHVQHDGPHDGNPAVELNAKHVSGDQAPNAAEDFYATWCALAGVSPNSTPEASTPACGAHTQKIPEGCEEPLYATSLDGT